MHTSLHAEEIGLSTIQGVTYDDAHDALAQMHHCCFFHHFGSTSIARLRTVH